MNLSSKMFYPNAVLIIGNGFDLNLGFNTSYNDFLESQDFLDVSAHNGFKKQLLRTSKKSNWIDIENELIIYSSDYRPSRSDFNLQFKEIVGALSRYLQSLDYSSFDQRSKAFEVLHKFKDDNLIVFNFNYTDSVEFLFKKIKMEKRPSVKEVVQIHGSCSYLDGIIFGVQDGAKILEDHMFLLKSGFEAFKGSEIIKCMGRAEKIIFFGHSLGETDYPYFKDLFSNICNSKESSGKTIEIYYNDEDSRLDLLKHLNRLTSKRIGVLKSKSNFKFTRI